CQALADQFRNASNLKTPSLILSSHEVKAFQTGAQLANRLDIKFGGSAINGFEEQDRSGAPFFDSRAQFDYAIENFFKQTGRPVFGRESADQAAARFHVGITQAVTTYPHDGLGIVSHGRVITAFLNRFTTIDPFPFWKSLTMPAVIEITWPKIEIESTQLFE
ncbi:MAG: histidine phosphatase family protein, partial [Chloroflexota bacterium]